MQTDSRVLLESNAPPAMSVVLGKVSELAAAQRDALLALEAPLVELDAAEDAAQVTRETAVARRWSAPVSGVSMRVNWRASRGPAFKT